MGREEQRLSLVSSGILKSCWLLICRHVSGVWEHTVFLRTDFTFVLCPTRHDGDITVQRAPCCSNPHRSTTAQNPKSIVIIRSLSCCLMAASCIQCETKKRGRDEQRENVLGQVAETERQSEAERAQRLTYGHGTDMKGKTG